MTFLRGLTIKIVCVSAIFTLDVAPANRFSRVISSLCETSWTLDLHTPIFISETSIGTLTVILTFKKSTLITIFRRPIALSSTSFQLSVINDFIWDNEWSSGCSPIRLMVGLLVLWNVIYWYGNHVRNWLWTTFTHDRLSSPLTSQAIKNSNSSRKIMVVDEHANALATFLYSDTKLANFTTQLAGFTMRGSLNSAQRFHASLSFWKLHKLGRITCRPSRRLERISRHTMKLIELLISLRGSITLMLGLCLVSTELVKSERLCQHRAASTTSHYSAAEAMTD